MRDMFGTVGPLAYICMDTIHILHHCFSAAHVAMLLHVLPMFPARQGCATTACTPCALLAPNGMSLTLLPGNVPVTVTVMLMMHVLYMLLALALLTLRLRRGVTARLSVPPPSAKDCFMPLKFTLFQYLQHNKHIVIYPGSTPVGNATLVVANVLTCDKHSSYRQALLVIPAQRWTQRLHHGMLLGSSLCYLDLPCARAPHLGTAVHQSATRRRMDMHLLHTASRATTRSPSAA
jgi:hypothetical protein